MNKLVDKCLNASLGRWENFWASEKPSVVTLEEEEDVWNKLVYTMCNLVEAGLVAKAEKWPGIIAFLPGQTIHAKRPKVYFRKNGEMPKSAKLTLTAPPQMGRFKKKDYIAPPANGRVRPPKQPRKATDRTNCRDRLSAPWSTVASG